MPTQQAYEHRRSRRPGVIDAGVISAAYDFWVLGDGPWGYWPMNEASGTTIADISGNGRNATVVGSPTLGQSGWRAQGNAIGFTGNVSNYLSIASTTGLTTTDPFTWEALVYWTGSGTFGVVASRGPAFPDQVHALQLHNTALGHFMWASEYNVTVSGMNSAWRHVAITYDGATRRIYLDGSEVGTGSAYTTPAWNNTPIYIGRTIGGGLPFNGKIQKVAYYTRALTATEIAEHYASLGPSV